MVISGALSNVIRFSDLGLTTVCLFPNGYVVLYQHKSVARMLEL